MKRAVIILLALTVALGMVACGSSSDTAALESENAELKERLAALEGAQETATTEETATETPSEDPVLDSAPVETMPVEEQLLMDKEGVQIFYTGIDPDASSSGPEVKVRIVNNSENDWYVQARDFAVNDIMTDQIFSANVPSGKTANDGILMERESLEENGITGVDQIQKVDFFFHVFDFDNQDINFDSDIIEIHPNS